MDLDLHKQRQIDWRELSESLPCAYGIYCFIEGAQASVTNTLHRSFDDMGPVDEDERWAPFKDMHEYLRNTFPLMCVRLKPRLQKRFDKLSISVMHI